MTTFGEAVAALGIPETDAEDVIIVKIKNGRAVHSSLRELRSVAVDRQADVYVASGSFVRGSVSETSGRSRENVSRVHFVPFDCDLSDWLKADKESVYALPQDEIEAVLPYFCDEIAAAFESLGLPLHYLAYTGHGLLALVRIADGNAGNVSEIQAAHKKIIGRINAAAKIRLVDPAASDAGTRIFRIVPSLNGKATSPRPTRVLLSEPGSLLVSQFLGIAGTQSPRQPDLLLAPHAKRLSDGDARAIVDALKPYWQQGSRHALALGLGGMLAKAGVPEEQAVVIVGEIADGDEDGFDRQRAVRTSYERLGSGQQTRGFYALRELLPPSAATFIDARLASLRASTSGVILQRKASGAKQDESDGEAVLDIRPAPDICYRGWIGDYVSLVQPTTEASAQFHLVVGLTMAGALIGRAVAVQYGADTIYPNLYTLLVGRSGKTRKDTAIKRGLRVLAPLPLSEKDERDELQRRARGQFVAPTLKTVTDVGSSEGLIAMLSEHPHLLLVSTEFSKLIGNARRKGTSTIIPTLIEAWDTPAFMETLTRVNPLRAQFPCVSALAATQPTILQNLMSEDDVHSGFGNRWLIALGPQTSPLPEAAELDEERARQIAAALIAARDSYPSDARLRMSDAARDRWREWYVADFNRPSANEDEDAMRVRHAVLIQKLALIYAVSERSREIGLEHLEAAIALVDWSWFHVRQLVGAWGVGIESQIEQRILAHLAKHGPKSRRRLQQAISSKKWSGRDFSNVLEIMVKNGFLVVDVLGTIGLAEDLEA